MSLFKTLCFLGLVTGEKAREVRSVRRISPAVAGLKMEKTTG